MVSSPPGLNPGPSLGCSEEGGARRITFGSTMWLYIYTNKTEFGPFQIITTFENIGLNLLSSKTKHIFVESKKNSQCPLDCKSALRLGHSLSETACWHILFQPFSSLVC